MHITRDSTCGQGLAVDVQMYFQKLNPQQEEGKFFGGPEKASHGAVKDSICYLDLFLTA